MDASLGEAWPSLAYDIRSAQHSQTKLDDVDSCVALIVDLCFICISVKVDPRVVLSMVALTFWSNLGQQLSCFVFQAS